MMSLKKLNKILIYGNNLAASMTVLALSKSLPNSIALIWIKPNTACLEDVLYGGITSPEAYQFNLQYGITEPELILETNTTFSFGSRYSRWGEHNRTWLQCFHLPFNAESGVEFHHLMTKHNAVLNDYLISAQAALKGTFAHPPADKPQSALSRAEYGYHFEASQWSGIFASKVDTERVNIIPADVTTVVHSQNQIEYVQFGDGSSLQADLYIDCSGVNGQLLSKLDNVFDQQRAIQISLDNQPCCETGPAYRSIEEVGYGWRSVTPLRDRNIVVSLYESSIGDVESDTQTILLGHRRSAWQGNCVGIGHSAYTLEPVSPAPYILLTKDIKRLLELIPIGVDTNIERKEYNQRYCDDVVHAELFHRALYFEQRDVGFDKSEKLERKLKQYMHRGILTSFDFEPFNQQDWAVLHAGLNRKPERFDRLAEQIDFDQMQAKLDKMRAGIGHLASSMPPHHIYLSKLSDYLRDNKERG